MTDKRLASELESIAGELELQAYESGDFSSEDYYMERAKIVRLAVTRIRDYDSSSSGI